jgi:thymidylate kinase
MPRSHRPNHSPEVEQFLKKFFLKLNQEEILYVVLRNHEMLPESVDNDVDLLIAKNNLHRFIESLTQVCTESYWAPLKHIHRLTYYSIILHHPDSVVPLLQLDFWTRIDWKSVPYVAEKKLLGSRRFAGGVWIPRPGFEASVTLMKDVLQFGLVKEKGDGEVKRSIHSNATKDPEGFKDALQPSFSRSEVESLVEMVMAADWKAIEDNTAKWRSDLIRRRITSRPFKQFSDWVLFIAAHLQTRLQRPRGRFISVFGPDGSGKTTTIAGLTSQLNMIYPSIRHMHGRPKIIPAPGQIKQNIFGSRASASAPKAEAGPWHGVVETPKSKGRIWSKLVFSYYILDYVLLYPIVFINYLRGDVLIADRYFYDFVILSKEMFGIPFSIARKVMWFIPTPKMSFFLFADTKTIRERKQELSEESIALQNTRYLTLNETCDEITLIDASGTPEQTVALIISQLLHSDHKPIEDS